MSNFSTSDILFKALDGQINIDSAQGIVECFVAAIGNKDSVGDVIVSGAFTESLKRRKPRVVWGHNWNDPIGKVLEIYEVPANDPRIPMKMKIAGVGGLYARVQFNLATEKGREGFASVAFFGQEQEWSIGYKTLQATFDPNMQANVLREVELYEVSPVLHGANQLTATLSVKSDDAGEKCGPEGMPGGMHGSRPGSTAVDIPRFNLVPMKPRSFSAENERTDIFAQGESGQLGDEARTALEMELSSRSSSPLRVVNATENSVVFDRTMPDGTRMTYRIGYHRDSQSGRYMFGKPEKMASQQIVPSQMPSMPMSVKPGYVTQSYSDAQQPIAMMKSFDEQLDQAVEILSNAGEDETVKENELQKIQDAIDYLRNLSGGQQKKAALEYSVWCKPKYAYQVKSLLDPVLDYHRLEAHVDDYGVHVTSGLNEDSLQALRSAHKNIASYLDGGGGSKKGDGAPNTKAAPKTRVKALSGKIGPKLGGGLRAAPAGMAFVDITGVTDADSDGIVFEGKPGLERPIIPRFTVPKELARKLSSVVEGDAEAIEKQRRAGNGNVSFDEKKLRGIIDDIGGDPNLLQNISTDGMRSRSGDPDIDAQLDEQDDRQFRENRLNAPRKKPQKSMRELREENRLKRQRDRAEYDTESALDDLADMQRDMEREEGGMRSRGYVGPPDSWYEPDEDELEPLEELVGEEWNRGDSDRYYEAARDWTRENVDKYKGMTDDEWDSIMDDVNASDDPIAAMHKLFKEYDNSDAFGDDIRSAAESDLDSFYEEYGSRGRGRGFRSRSGDPDIDAQLDEQDDRQFRENRLNTPRKKPQKSMRELREENRLKRQREAENDPEYIQYMLDEQADMQRDFEREERGMRSTSQRKIYSDQVAADRARKVLEDDGVDPRDLFQGDDESTQDYLDRITPLIEKYAPEIFDGRSLDEFVSKDNISEVNKLIDNAYSNNDVIREGLDVRVFNDGMGDASESRLWMDFVDTEVDIADGPAGSFLHDSGLVDYIETEGDSDGDWSWSIDVSKASPEDKKRFVASAVSDAIMSHEGSWGKDGFVLRDKDRGMRSQFGRNNRRIDDELNSLLNKYGIDLEKVNFKPAEESAVEQTGWELRDLSDKELEELRRPIPHLVKGTNKFRGFRSQITDGLRNERNNSLNPKVTKEQRAFDILAQMSQRSGQKFGLSDKELQDIFDGDQKINPELMKIVRSELKRQGFTKDDVADVLSGRYAGYARNKISGAPDDGERIFESEMESIANRAFQESMGILSDGLTVDQFQDFVSFGRIPQGKESIIARANEVYDNIVKDSDKQRAMGLRSRTGRNIDAEIDTNIKKQRDLEKELDDEKIDLAEFRRRQAPLRQEFSNLRKEQGAESATRKAPELDATGRPRREMIERDEKGKVKFDSEKFLAEQNGKRRSTMSELGFTEDEINTLMGASPSGMRSRSGSHENFKNTRDAYLSKNSEAIVNKLEELTQRRDELDAKSKELMDQYYANGRDFNDEENDLFDEIENELDSVNDEIKGITDWAKYAVSEDTQRLVGKTGTTKARVAYKKMLDDGDINQEEYDALITDLIDPAFFDDEHWDSVDAISFVSNLRDNFEGSEFDDIDPDYLITEKIDDLSSDFADEKVTEALDRLKNGGMRSRSGKKNNSEKRKMNTKLTPDQLRIMQEQKLRSKKIPGKKKDGPSKNEWGFRSREDFGNSAGAAINYISEIFSKDNNDLSSNEKYLRRHLLDNGIKIDFYRGGREDAIGSDISLRNNDKAGMDEKLDALINAISKDKKASDILSNNGFLMDDRIWETMPSYKKSTNRKGPKLGDRERGVEARANIIDLAPGDVLPENWDDETSAVGEPMIRIADIRSDGQEDGYVTMVLENMSDGSTETRTFGTNDTFPNVSRPSSSRGGRQQGMRSQANSGSINWDSADEDWGDGAGGSVTAWTTPEGGRYQIDRWEGGGNDPGGSIATVYDANNKRVAQSEKFSWGSDDAKKFLQDYHEENTPTEGGMRSRDARMNQLSRTRRPKKSGFPGPWEINSTGSKKADRLFYEPGAHALIFKDNNGDWKHVALAGITKKDPKRKNKRIIERANNQVMDLEQSGKNFDEVFQRIMDDKNNEVIDASPVLYEKFKKGENLSNDGMPYDYRGSIGMRSRTMREQDPRAYDDVYELIDQGLSDQEIYDSLAASRISGAKEMTLSKIGQIRSGGRELTQDSNKRGFVRKKNTRKINDRFDGQQMARLSASRGGRYGERADIEEGLSDVQEIANGMRSKAGTGLGESREIYPSRRMAESSAVDFVRYDAAKEELVVQYKGGGAYVFGGISADDADNIEEAESLGKALNDVKRNATYSVKPNGDVNGVESTTVDFLERDLRRVPLSGDEKNVYNNAIRLLRDGIDEDSDFAQIQSQVTNISNLANDMWANDEYAASNFLSDAAEKINKKLNSVRGQGGFRSRAGARHQRMEVNLSADEIGEIRNEIRGITAKHGGNGLITYGMKKYDNLLEEWQNQKKSNPGRSLTVLSSEYDNIMTAYDELEKVDPSWIKMVGADPLEMASVSKEAKYISPNVDVPGESFDGKRINNGAPADITPRMQNQLIDWGRRQPNFRIVKGLVEAHEKNNGTMTARQWSTLRNMFDRFSEENRSGGVRSRVGSGMRSETGSVMSAPRAGKGKGPRAAKDALPENYDTLSLDEKFDALISAGKYDESTNPNGIQVGEYNAAFRRLRDAEDEQDRITARREALAERMKRSAEAGPVTRRPEVMEQEAPRRANDVETTPEKRAALAKRTRQKQMSAIEKVVAKAQDSISGAIIDGDAEDEHGNVWNEVMDLVQAEDGGDDADLTLSKLSSIIEALDDYTIGFEGEEMSPAERKSVNNATKLKNTLEELYDDIDSDPFIKRGSTSREQTGITLAGEEDDSTPRFMTGEGLRSRSGLVNSYVGSRKNAERRPNAGMRSRSGTAQEGRAEVRWEATEFNKVEQSLGREISEAQKSGDSRTANALRNLTKIMDRQKSGDVGGKRTNAGALYLTQNELDDVIDALMHVVDRQTQTGGSRTNMFAQMLDKLAEAGMATFIQKTAKEVNSRFVEKTNEAGRTVKIPLNE